VMDSYLPWTPRLTPARVKICTLFGNEYVHGSNSL
jgi:hypothetical protein